MRPSSWPSTTICPPVGRSSPATRLSRVDLPLPEGPMMATNSPAPTARSTPASALTAVPYALFTPESSTSLFTLVLLSLFGLQRRHRRKPSRPVGRKRAADHRDQQPCHSEPGQQERVEDVEGLGRHVIADHLADGLDDQPVQQDAGGNADHAG